MISVVYIRFAESHIDAIFIVQTCINHKVPWASRPPCNAWNLGPRKSAAKWHLDRFSHFAGHICVTHRHTDTQTVTLRATSVTIGHILCTARNGECDAA